jgi:hypothetical protein
MTRTLFLAAGLAAALSATPAPAADPGVAPPNSNPYGRSYAEWSARHWQWLFSIPAGEHPLADLADVDEFQSGQVWFLGGTFSSVEVGPGVILGSAERTGTIPPGKALFFPLVDVEGSTLEGNGDTEAELRDYAESIADHIVPGSLFLEIDGRRVKNLIDYRVQSPLFTFGPLPEDNVFGDPDLEGATSPVVSDGVFAMLRPLSVGTHTIRFGGAIDLSDMGGPLFIQDIKYTITVRPR